MAGPNFMNTEKAALHLGFFSTRKVDEFLTKLRSVLSSEERESLTDFHTGARFPNAEDSFPDTILLPKLDKMDLEI